jgi:hypothetical protein
MSNPWPPYIIPSWRELMALFHPDVVYTTHPPDSPLARMSGPGPGWPGLELEPSPSPWRSTVSSLIAVISLREVASKMPDGQVKLELGKRVDGAISRFIDDCGTKHPGWPYPGPPPFVYPIASELAVAANAITESNVRNEVLQLAGKIIERASGSIGRREVRLPSPEEIDEMTAFPSDEDKCKVLCQDLLDTFEELDGATGKLRRTLLRRLGALHRQRRELHCTDPCLPQ